MKKTIYYISITAGTIILITFFCCLGIGQGNFHQKSKKTQFQNEYESFKPPVGFSDSEKKYIFNAIRTRYDLNNDSDVLNQLKKIAEHGDSSAQFILAFWLLYNGKNQSDINSGLTWLHEAANNDSASAQLELALNYFYGLYTEVDYEQAFPWVIKLAEKKNAKTYGPAMFLLSRYYSLGLGKCPKDYEKSMVCLHEASAVGFPWADYTLYLRYSAEFPEKLELATKHLRNAAANGIPEAQILYGMQAIVWKNPDGIKLIKQAEQQSGLTLKEFLNGWERGERIFTFARKDNPFLECLVK